MRYPQIVTRFSTEPKGLFEQFSCPLVVTLHLHYPPQHMQETGRDCAPESRLLAQLEPLFESRSSYTPFYSAIIGRPVRPRLIGIES